MRATDADRSSTLPCGSIKLRSNFSSQQPCIGDTLLTTSPFTAKYYTCCEEPAGSRCYKTFCPNCRRPVAATKQHRADPCKPWHWDMNSMLVMSRTWASASLGMHMHNAAHTTNDPIPIFSFGNLSFRIFSFGSLALGSLALGSLALETLALRSLALGSLALGSLA